MHLQRQHLRLLLRPRLPPLHRLLPAVLLPAVPLPAAPLPAAPLPAAPLPAAPLDPLPLQAPHLPLALLAAPALLLPLDLDLLLLLTTIEAVARRYKFIDLLYLKILCLL